MHVRIGYGLGTGTPTLDGSRFGDLVDALEDLHFDSLWLSERVTGACPDPIVGLSFAAARTRSLKLGTSVQVLPGRNPHLLAKEWATLDRLSSGRALPAFGLGVADGAEQAAFGVARGERAARFDALLPLVRRLWAGEEVDGAAIAPRPVQDPLEVWLGGGSIYTGSARVTATLRALGLYDSYINGGYILGTTDRRPIPLTVVEQPSYYNTGKYTSAWDLARIHKFLHRGAGGHGALLGLSGHFTASDARFLLWTLAHVLDPGKLDRYVGDKPGVSVLHKAGWISVARHDSGLVYWQDGGFVAVVMTYSSAGVGASSDVLAGEIARTAFKHFSRTSSGARVGGRGRLFSF